MLKVNSYIENIEKTLDKIGKEYNVKIQFEKIISKVFNIGIGKLDHYKISANNNHFGRLTIRVPRDNNTNINKIISSLLDQDFIEYVVEYINNVESSNSIDMIVSISEKWRNELDKCDNLFDKDPDTGEYYTSLVTLYKYICKKRYRPLNIVDTKMTYERLRSDVAHVISDGKFPQKVYESIKARYTEADVWCGSIIGDFYIPKKSLQYLKNTMLTIYGLGKVIDELI